MGTGDGVAIGIGAIGLGIVDIAVMVGVTRAGSGVTLPGDKNGSALSGETNGLMLADCVGRIVLHALHIITRRTRTQPFFRIDDLARFLAALRAA